MFDDRDGLPISLRTQQSFQATLAVHCGNGFDDGFSLY
jgi:hypothetical protein